MPGYVDGFVISIPKKNLNAYKKMAKIGCKVWMSHGALDYKECVADDMKVMKGAKSFPKLAKTKSNEVVIFAYITYKSRKHRDEVNKKVMKDKRLQGACDKDNMPFSMKNMAYGGFKALVEA